MAGAYVASTPRVEIASVADTAETTWSPATDVRIVKLRIVAKASTVALRLAFVAGQTTTGAGNAYVLIQSSPGAPDIDNIMLFKQPLYLRFDQAQAATDVSIFYWY